MKNTIKSFIVLLSLLIISSCSKNIKIVNMCTDVDYEELFPSVAGQKYCFPDGNQIKILMLRNDFCPCDADCKWEGEMILSYNANIDNTNYEGKIGSSLGTPNIIADKWKMTFDTITFVEDCSSTNSTPEIKNATISILKI